MFGRFSDWFGELSIEDPVDRRNARALQGLLLFLGTTLPLATGFGLAVLWPVRHLAEGSVQMWMPHGMSFALSALCFICMGLIRAGAFRPAVKALLVGLLATLFINAATSGFEYQLPAQLHPMLLIVLSGLILGQRTLWLMFGALVASVLVGAVRDAVSVYVHDPIEAFVNVPPAVFGYLAVAVLTNRTTSAMRESLRESSERQAALELEIQERERTHAQLIHAQKKEITERMAAGMAHDLNNIFAVIAGFSASAIEDDGKSDGDRVVDLERSLRAIEDSARRGMAANRKVLRFSRLDMARPETFDASDAVGELTPMLRQLLEANIVLTVEPAQAPLPIHFDRSQFELLLLNLASNARDAMDGEGALRISLSKSKETAVIEMEDNGCGMTQDVAERAFESFFSTKPADQGTGLGLSVVRDLIEKSRGTISLATAPGEGAVFTITLPLHGASEA